MRTRSQPLRKGTKRKQVKQEQLQTCFQNHSEQRQFDSQIQESNSQLSHSLSANFNPKQIRCREHQKSIISKFIKSCLSSEAEENTRVLWVPGVGKTISTMQIVNKIKKSIKNRKVIFRYINGLALTTPSNIYKKINKQLYNVEKNDLKKNAAFRLLQKMIQDKRIKFLIIDEIDYLYTRNQNILYNLFQWANSPVVKLCLITIANTMDFPQRLMPKLRSRMGQNRLVFRPYTHQEIKQIIQDRLMKSDRFSKDAIAYACKKMTTYTSDVRKIIQILRRALQRKKFQVVTVEDMCKQWKLFAQDSGQLWQEKLPEFYRNIVNIIRQHGGVSTSLRIYQRMCVIQQFKLLQILDTLKQLQQMSIVKLKQKKQKGLLLLQVQLSKI